MIYFLGEFAVVADQTKEGEMRDKYLYFAEEADKSVEYGFVETPFVDGAYGKVAKGLVKKI